MDWIFLKEAMGRFTYDADSTLVLHDPYERKARMVATVISDPLDSGQELKTARGYMDEFGRAQQRHLEGFLKSIQGATKSFPKKWARTKFKEKELRQWFKNERVETTMVIDVDTPKEEEQGDLDFIVMVRFFAGSYFKKFKVK